MVEKLYRQIRSISEKIIRLFNYSDSFISIVPIFLCYFRRKNTFWRILSKYHRSFAPWTKNRRFYGISDYCIDCTLLSVVGTFGIRHLVICMVVFLVWAIVLVSDCGFHRAMYLHLSLFRQAVLNITLILDCFSHPGLLALLAILVAILYFVASCPEAEFIILLIIVIGTCFRNWIKKYETR